MGEICKYKMIVTESNRIYCGAYSVSKRSDKKIWAHYPICDEENCPIINASLLEGASLPEEPITNYNKN